MNPVGGVVNFQPALVDVEKAKRWTGSRALVPLPVDRCPDCERELHASTTAQLPLIRHGGYGEQQANRVVSCECGYVRHAGRTSENTRSA